MAKKQTPKFKIGQTINYRCTSFDAYQKATITDIDLKHGEIVYDVKLAKDGSLHWGYERDLRA